MRTSIVLSALILLAACGEKESSPEGEAGGVDTGEVDGSGGDGSGGEGSGGDAGSGSGTEDPDSDGDGFPASEDCDDTNAEIYPFADEYCDGVDNDCDGDTDESTAVDAQPFYSDEDGDGFGGEVATVACDQPSDTVSVGGDCDDEDDRYNPGAAEDDCTDPEDYNCDGEVAYADEDADGWAACQDCDDTDANVHPDAAEVCDGIDNDCDSLLDDADDSVDLTTRREFWPDNDGDAYGDASVSAILSCSAPADHVENDGDCDDTDVSVNPAATEVCDAADVDEDCNGVSDDADSGVLGSSLSEWFYDGDSDGYGAGTSTLACDAPGASWIATDGDCDDSASGVNPGATEICDAADTDEDCDGSVDDADSSVDSSTKSTWYPDADTDGYGDPTGSTIVACNDPSSTTAYTTDNTDCNDADSAINPAADEVCDAADTDEDCNGLADDADSGLLASSASAFYPDTDGDGYGDGSAVTYACDDPDGTSDGWITDDTDCDDTDSAVNPGATEICDDVDNDCDASTTGAGTVSYDSGSGTLSDVSSTFAGSSSSVAVATLSSGTYYFCDDTFYVSLTASSSTTVELVGSGSAVLSGATTDRILEMDGATVTLTDITLEEGYHSSYGGAVYCDSNGDLTTSNVVFQDNESGYYGGAITLDECDADFVDTTFDSNSAAAHGGAIYSDYADITTDNADFTDNYAFYQGGGATIFRSSLYTTDTVWDGNTNGAGSYSSNAAALYLNSSDFSCVYNTRGGFTNNAAGRTNGTGGVHFAPGPSIYLYNYGCDWGSSTAGNDNTLYDLWYSGYTPYYGGVSTYYTINGAINFYCDDTTGCYAF